MTWKYVPNTLLTHDAGYRHVVRMEADSLPDDRGVYMLRCTLDNGRVRTFGSVKRPYITSDLRMAIFVNERDEVRMAWENVANAEEFTDGPRTYGRQRKSFGG